MKEEYIKSFDGLRFVGIIKTDSNGNKTAIDFNSRQILGYYKKASDITTDFYGRLLYKGDALAALFTR